MKIFDSNAYTMNPLVQIWGGVVMGVLSLFIGLMTLSSSMDTLRIFGCFWFVNVLSMAWMAWRGYQRQPKSEESSK